MKEFVTKTPKGIFIGLFVLSSLFLARCTNENVNDNLSNIGSTSSGYTKITGYIRNIDVYPDTKDITINVSHVSGQDRVTQIKAPIHDDATFNFIIDLARPQDVTMLPYLDFLCLIPGDSLHIEIDFNNLFDVRLSGGPSAEINRDFFKYFDATGYRTTDSNYMGVGTDCEMNCPWDEIMKKLDEERNQYRERRQTFLLNNKVSDDVVFLTEAMIELDYYKALMGTIFRREHWGKEIMDYDVLMSELNEVSTKYFNTEMFSNSHFKYISSYIFAASLAEQVGEGIDFADWINEVAIADNIKEFMFAAQAGKALIQKDLDDFEKFAKHVNNEYLLDRLMQEYRTVKMNMLNPENLSSFMLGNPKDFPVFSLDKKTFLDSIIESNHGKAQVIEIYASWCAPCKDVLQQLGTIKKEYDGKDVSISYICVTLDDEKTRELFRANGFDDSSIHFITTDDFYFLARTFSPISFPYGILVNRQGVIVDHGSHVRPAIKLREKIDLLLKQNKLIK